MIVITVFVNGRNNLHCALFVMNNHTLSILAILSSFSYLYE